MKKFASILLTIAVFITLCGNIASVYAAGASISITSGKTVLVVGQTTSVTISASSSVTNIDVAIDDRSVLAYDDTNNTITGLKKGTAVITVTGEDSNGTLLSDSITIKVRTPTGLIDGTDYYIMNCNTGNFLSLASASDVDGMVINGRARSTSLLSQWTADIAENGNGVTELISVYSSANRRVHVSGTNLRLNDTSGTQTRFGIHRVESGTYQGKYLIRFDNKFVAMDTNNTVYLATSLNAGAYWCFMAVEKGYADIYSHNYNYTDSDGVIKNYNSTTNNELFDNTLQSVGYLTVVSVNETAEYAYQYLTDDDVFVFRGHGTPAMIWFYGNNGRVNGIISADEALPRFSSLYPINQMTENSLAKLRCALLLGCNTADDYNYGGKTYNLLDSFFMQGAHFVLGTTESIYASDNSKWLKHFLQKISEDECSIADACSYAIEKMGGIYVPYEKNDGSEGTKFVESFPLDMVGDGSQYLH